MNDAICIISIRDNPEFLETGIDYFTAKWQIDRRIYADCISHSLATPQPLPRWYLLMKNDTIIGCYGLITNDFISRQDLYPWLCALYVEKDFRGRQLGSQMLAHGRNEAARLGFANVYLATDHIDYYEKYGWSFIGTGFHPWGDSSRIYTHQAFIENHTVAEIVQPY